MLGSQENVRGILDADDAVRWRVEHQQCFAQVGKAIVDALRCDVIEKFAFDAERPTGELHFNLALFTNLIDVLLEKPNDMRRIAGSSDAHDRARIRDSMRGCENSGATQAMADQERGRAVGLS